MKNDREELLRVLSSENASPEEIIFDNEEPNPDVIGKFISGIANSSAKNDKDFGLLIWGVNTITGNIDGSYFDPESLIIEGKSLPTWLQDLTENNVEFDFTSLDLDGVNLVILEVLKPLTEHVTFKGREYFIEDGRPKEVDLEEDESVTQNVSNDIERASYSENNNPKINIRPLNELLDSLDFETYFELMDESIPADEIAVANVLQKAGIIGFDSLENGYYLTNVGALALSKSLSEHPGLRRRHLILKRYSGINKGGNCDKRVFDSGYLVSIGQAIRAIQELTRMPDPITGEADVEPSPYPIRAIRELVVNALLHQDLDGSNDEYGSPLIEIFDDRIEISNTANIKINIATLVNTQPWIRNVELYALFAKVSLCGNKEHGWELVIDGCEQAQLPSPSIEGIDLFTLIKCVEEADISALSYDDQGNPNDLRAAVSSYPVAALSLIDAHDKTDEYTKHGEFASAEDSRIEPGTKILAEAPIVQTTSIEEATCDRFCVVVSAPMLYRNMSEDAKMASAYWHACSLFAKGDVLTNTSLRERFDMSKSQTAQVSRLLRACIDVGLLKTIDEDAPLKLRRYMPAWA